ncbi:hypothetical protein SEA_GENAMY16_66 [Gordonia phage Genamy16]|uniref:DNA-binding phage zinc finger domain-containing protein n=2 Tax=Lambovirus TaxID=2843412 RepID=A0A9E7Q815_9CAUD|nr:hypothetical protein SEA_GENAMY16_66 [Gordonia phage Genamy16]UVF61805.1 hypothetical protein SEA_NOVASHARKS_65 [Gordonia phage NovaSharks]UVK63180.1 hypothetical protein SEA_RUMI_64 [Gordonia phage Rumi]WNM65403.1 hypothetical protein SEA_ALYSSAMIRACLE_66 [Gordonia phage Alyssamiracle]
MSQESRRQKALMVDCPNCLAKPHERCTQPTDTGRKPVRWVHLKRENAASEHET